MREKDTIYGAADLAKYLLKDMLSDVDIAFYNGLITRLNFALGE
jgi:hypothetical protein